MSVHVNVSIFIAWLSETSKVPPVLLYNIICNDIRVTYRHCGFKAL